MDNFHVTKCYELAQKVYENGIIFSIDSNGDKIFVDLHLFYSQNS